MKTHKVDRDSFWYG